MARMIRKQKGILGESIYTDSHFRTVGTSRKFGNSELLFDRNGKYIGQKRKGLFGEDVYLDEQWRVKGYGTKTPLGTVYSDKDFRYKGWGGNNPVTGETAFLNDDEAGEDLENSRNEPATAGEIIGAILFLAIFLGGGIWFLSQILK